MKASKTLTIETIKLMYLFQLTHQNEDAVFLQKSNQLQTFLQNQVQVCFELLLFYQTNNFFENILDY